MSSFSQLSMCHFQYPYPEFSWNKSSHRLLLRSSASDWRQVNWWHVLGHFLGCWFNAACFWSFAPTHTSSAFFDIHLSPSVILWRLRSMLPNYKTGLKLLHSFQPAELHVYAWVCVCVCTSAHVDWIVALWSHALTIIKHSPRAWNSFLGMCR